jgi:DNA-binding LacI/PurR family transcriptional regulator
MCCGPGSRTHGYAEPMAQRRKRATIRDVAKATGLSPAAVSYALRGLQVPEATQERVRRAAQELGYEADPIARALSSGRTGTVGVLCGSLEDLWQQGLAASLGRALLAEERYGLVVDAHGDPERERALARQLRDQRVDGLIVFPLDPADEQWTDIVATLPVVTIGDALVGAPTAGEVLFDNEQGVAMALGHLATLGHERVAVLTPTQPATPDRPAEVLTVKTAEELGLDVTLVPSPHSIDGATEVAVELLGRRPRPTAVFCLSDSMAYGVYAAARQLGIGVPAELSVLGYDDHPMSRLLSPPLTTFGWDVPGLVDAAVSRLVSAIEADKRSRRVVVRPTLRDRESTARPRRRRRS